MIGIPDFAERFLLAMGQAYHPAFIGKITGDKLAYPPARVGTKTGISQMAVFFRSVHKPHVSFLNNIHDGCARRHVISRQLDHEPQIGIDKLMQGGFIAVLYTLR